MMIALSRYGGNIIDKQVFTLIVLSTGFGDIPLDNTSFDLAGVGSTEAGLLSAEEVPTIETVVSNMDISMVFSIKGAKERSGSDRESPSP